ncbi:MAG: hypothetical protein E7546_06840 [Ruminococcaceae bacterium]|nr:hypothetical protein [Oscillospiraceae bacterium]
MGGVTHAMLAQEFGVPVATIRRRAAQEGWKKQRKQKTGETDTESQKKTHISRQLEITDRLLDIIAQALENPDELFGYVECQKVGGEVEFAYEKIPYINDARLARLVKAVSDIFELQRLALCIPEFKEQHDAQFAERKLDLELLKIEKSAKNMSLCADDGFIAALGLEIASEGTESDIDSI